MEDVVELGDGVAAFYADWHVGGLILALALVLGFDLDLAPGLE